MNGLKWRYYAKIPALIRSEIEKMLTELTRIKIVVIRCFHKGTPRQPVIRVLHHESQKQ